MNIVGEAFAIADSAHRGTYRKGYNLPYLVHPMRVADSLGRHLKDEKMLAAALLHDVLEDCAEDRLVEYQQRIRQQCGADVLALVEELTKPALTDKAVYMASFRTKSVEALIIKLFDRVDNIMDFTFHQPDYAMSYAAKALPMYEAVLARLEEINVRFGYKFASMCDDVVGKLIIQARHYNEKKALDKGEKPL